MKKKMLIVALSVICLLGLVNSCIYNPRRTHVVVVDKVIVEFGEYRESPTINSSVVTDRFKEALVGALNRNNVKIEDVEEIGMVAGAYQVDAPSKAGHDWVISGRVTMARQDDPKGPVTGGPENFINMMNQSLDKAKKRPVYANLNCAGVRIVNRALADLLDGKDPRLVITLESNNIKPAPSPSDPLEFSWHAEVVFQAVVKVHVKGRH